MDRTLREIMTDECFCVTKQDNVYETAVKMREHNIGFVPVVEGRKLVGVITDRDLVIRGYADKKSGSSSVEEVMSTDITCASPDTSVDEAAKMMAQKQIRRLPVCENGELIGVVAIGDMAVRNIYKTEAGHALSQISEPQGSMR
ncbi:CBS domain-containing protein [Marinicrinis lubricantis]|uniref:CBS domain-containing protein n=1 Tax=Marinicrinis lubricantis TaxID=2086470 RepID=A0ABW1IMU2_9BACL